MQFRASEGGRVDDEQTNSLNLSGRRASFRANINMPKFVRNTKYDHDELLFPGPRPADLPSDGR
jgi:hypothetical protein